MNEQEVAFANSSVTTAETLNQTEVIINKKTDKVIKSWEDYEASEMPLLAAIPNKDIYLYDTKNDQVVLAVGNDKYYYNWLCLTPRFILPKMLVSDFDADGKDELSVVLYSGSGTGVSIEDLHIIEISEGKTLSGNQTGNANPESFKDHIFGQDDYVSQLQKAVSFKTSFKAGELMGEIAIDNKKYIVSLKDFQSEEYGEISEDIIWGNIVSFNSENNKLVAKLGVGIACENFASPDYIGTLYAQVNYKAGKFELTNFRFDENME